MTNERTHLLPALTDGVSDANQMMNTIINTEPEIATAALEVHKAICEGRWEVCTEDHDGLCWRAAAAAIPAYLSTLPIEYAGDHKHAGLQLVDDEDEPFESEQHALENFADYPNTTVVGRRVTAWVPVEVGL